MTGGPDAILAKPYAVEQLLTTLEEVLRGPKPSS
jgi:hypothetical protein